MQTPVRSESGPPSWHYGAPPSAPTAAPAAAGAASARAPKVKPARERKQSIEKDPDAPEAMTQALRSAADLGADLVMPSDPDADRLGCALPLPNRGWNADPAELALNGNQIGALLCHYLLSALNRRGQHYCLHRLRLYPFRF